MPEGLSFAVNIGVDQVIIGLASLGLGAIAVAIPMRAKHRDEMDARVLQETSARSSDTKTALEAWQAIVTTHVAQLQDQERQIKELRDRADACDELNRQLRVELMTFREP